jgi:hypothetical protein
MIRQEDGCEATDKCKGSDEMQFMKIGGILTSTYRKIKQENFLEKVILGARVSLIC